MIKREFKVNFKSYLIWFAILAGMFLFVYLLYPYIITDDTMQSIDELMKVFPEEVLKAFNMDLSSINTAYGWVKSEGLMFIMLCFGFYSSFLGGNILLKEENDKTIEYLGSLPIKRNKIVLNKIIVCTIYIVSMIVIFAIFNYICLVLSGDFDFKQFLLLFISPLFISLPLFSINLFISTFFHNNKKNIGISLGMVLLFYILSVLSELSQNISFIKYFSIYTLADSRNILTNNVINPIVILISFIITLVFVIGTFIRYYKKELL